MKKEELQKVIYQIKKYQLEDYVKDVSTWYSFLNEKQRANFLNLNVYPLKKLSQFREILVDLDFLNSDYYLTDAKLINESKSDVIAQCLVNIARDKDSQASNLHQFDERMIAYSLSDKTAQEKYSLICKRLRLENQQSNNYVDGDSLKSKNHIKLRPKLK